MIPDPWSIITGAAGAVAGWSWDQVAGGIARWVLEALTAPIDGTLNFLKTSTRPNLDASWFAGSDSPFAAVRNLAAVLLIAFLLAGIIQGLIASDGVGMLRRVALDAPMAVLGMVGVTVVVELLLDLTDAMSTAVLGGSDGTALEFLTTFGVTAHSASGGFSTVVLGIVALMATFVIWIELMVRSSLIYLLVAFSPLVFAASVWPSARGMLRRLVELLLAVILSKLAISIALSVGVAALGGTLNPDADGGVGEFAAQGLGNMVVGTAILAMAAFSPFIVLRLLPVAEAAVVAQGISRSPLNTGRSLMNTAYYGQSLTRLAGKVTSSSEGAEAPTEAGSPSFGDPDLAGDTGLSGGPAEAARAEPGGETAAGTGAEVGAGAAATEGGAATGADAGAVAGPAAVVAVGVAASQAAKDTAESTAEQAADAPSTSPSSESDAGWHSVPQPTDVTSDSTDIDLSSGGEP